MKACVNQCWSRLNRVHDVRDQINISRLPSLKSLLFTSSLQLSTQKPISLSIAFPRAIFNSHMLIRLKWLIQQGKVKGFLCYFIFFQLYDYQVGQCYEQGLYMHNCVIFEMIACFFTWFCLLDGVIFVFYIIFKGHNCFSQSCNCWIFFISWAQNK